MAQYRNDRDVYGVVVFDEVPTDQELFEALCDVVPIDERGADNLGYPVYGIGLEPDGGLVRLDGRRCGFWRVAPVRHAGRG